MICPEYQGSENRMKTLLLKGVLVYLLVMGVMGSYLSALYIRFSWVALHVVIFLCTMYCAALYYSKLWQDIGYLLLLGAMAAGGCLLGKYINSGFYSVANDLSEAASEFFDSNAMRSYGEQVGNRYFAVTVSMSYIGCVCCVIANISGVAEDALWNCSSCGGGNACYAALSGEGTLFFIHGHAACGHSFCAI